MQYLLGFTVLLAPTYVIRFNLFGLPTNLLMVWLFLLWVVFAFWLITRHEVFGFFAWLRSELNTKHLAFSILFLLAGTISLFVGDFSQEKLGQFIVLFFQPMGTFIVFRYLLQTTNYKLQTRNWFLVSCFLLLATSGLYAIVQYFTLIGVPQAWWGNAQEPKRALAFFLHPNFYALFVTPLLAFLIPQVVESQKSKVESQTSSLLYTLHLSLVTRVAWVLGAIGLLLSLSRGGWLGLVVAVGVYVLILGSRKIIKSALVVGALIVIIVVAMPNFRYRVMLPFQGEKSSVARISLWQTGWKMVKDSPVVGKGLLGFSNNWFQHNTDPGLAHYPAPHNIFLNFWVDTGMLGLVSFFGLIVLAIKRGWQNRKDTFILGLALACVAMLIHGLVDIPYLKNDLALMFWLLFAFI
jgi:putative inorganic carbon (hco3(-)) transporter